MTTLYLFDLDGTLCENNMTEPMPGVKDWFDRNRLEHPEDKYAICSNQGGVGYRYWLESVEKPWTDPSVYPTEDEIVERFRQIVHILGLDVAVYVCFAYQSKKSGKWAPTPDGCAGLSRWDHYHRKPAPGMLLLAIKESSEKYGAFDRIVFVGNGPEDMGAADEAKVEFVTAETFFGWAEIPF